MGAKLSKKKKSYCLGAGKDGESTETTEVEQKETENQDAQKDAAEQNGEKPTRDQSETNGGKEEQVPQDEKQAGVEVPSGESTKEDAKLDQNQETNSSVKEEDKPSDSSEGKPEVTEVCLSTTQEQVCEAAAEKPPSVQEEQKAADGSDNLNSICGPQGVSVLEPEVIESKDAAVIESAPIKEAVVSNVHMEPSQVSKPVAEQNDEEPKEEMQPVIEPTQTESDLASKEVAKEETDKAQEAPAPEPAQEAPAPEPAQEAPAPEPAQEAPAPEPAQEAPAPEPAQEAPAPEPAQEAPAPEPAQEAPAPEPAQEAPAPEPAQEAPAPEPAQEAPAPEPAQEAPAPEPAQEAPAPEPAQEAPAPEPAQEAPPAVGNGSEEPQEATAQPDEPKQSKLEELVKSEPEDNKPVVKQSEKLPAQVSEPEPKQEDEPVAETLPTEQSVPADNPIDTDLSNGESLDKDTGNIQDKVAEKDLQPPKIVLEEANPDNNLVEQNTPTEESALPNLQEPGAPTEQEQDLSLTEEKKPEESKLPSQQDDPKGEEEGRTEPDAKLAKEECNQTACESECVPPEPPMANVPEPNAHAGTEEESLNHELPEPEEPGNEKVSPATQQTNDKHISNGLPVKEETKVNGSLENGSDNAISDLNGQSHEIACNE